MAENKEQLGDTVGKGALGGTDLSGATGGTSTASGAQPGSGIPIITGAGDTGTDAPGVSNTPSHSPIEQSTSNTPEYDDQDNR
jgi:hypothetical protein